MGVENVDCLFQRDIGRQCDRITAYNLMDALVERGRILAGFGEGADMWTQCSEQITVRHDTEYPVVFDYYQMETFARQCA